MKYYVLSQKEDSGCQLGMLNAALYDKFYSDVADVQHGFFPWYARDCEMKRGCVFPKNGVLICDDDFYDFDIRTCLLPTIWTHAPRRLHNSGDNSGRRFRDECVELRRSGATA